MNWPITLIAGQYKDELPREGLIYSYSNCTKERVGDKIKPNAQLTNDRYSTVTKGGTSILNMI